YHSTYFAPNNLWLAISGDFDRAQLLTQIEATLGDWLYREVPQPTVPEVVPARQGQLQYVRRDIPQTTLLIGDLGLTKDDPDQYAARVLNYILGGGSFNSRLMREIRSDRGLAYSVYSYFQIGRRLPGPFVTGTETKNESVIDTLGLMRSIMVDLCDQPVASAELDLAKDSLINSFVFGFDDTHAVVTQQVRLDFFNYPQDYLNRYRSRIAAVTIEDVQRVAKRFIRPAHQQIVLVGNPEPYLGNLEQVGLPVVERQVELFQ
ncbi:MAG: insulinase family protein, partial [Desulfuromonas sp.]